VSDPRTASGAVAAAGVLCWRTVVDGALEVLLVHRPRDGDWSWPKGTLLRGEQLPEAAVREAHEETGVEVVLGRPLPGVAYRLPDGRDKQVSYWAARPAPGARAPRVPGREVDDVRWVAADRALDRLTYPADRAPLEALVGMHADGTLATVPLLVARHGTARPRDSWSGRESGRPLVAAGRRQALALAALLPSWRPERVVSSPWRRCVETVRPYLAVGGVRLRTKDGLSEDGARKSPGKARSHVARLLTRDRPVLVCTHRPVLPLVFGVLRTAAAEGVAADLPGSDPYLAPGEVLVAHVARPPGRGGRRATGPRVVAVERHAPRR